MVPVRGVGKVTPIALWWLVAPVLGVHLLALYLPGGASAVEIPYLDKVVHAVIFGVPVWLLGRLTGRVWLVAGAFALHAVISELIQLWFVPNRSGDPLDALADLIGIAIATWWLLRAPQEVG